MQARRTSQTVRFQSPFRLTGVEHVLEPGSYEIITDEELIEGLSFAAYRRLSTVMLARRGAPVEMLTIDPADLQRAQEQDLRGLVR